jgi:hypothetical protein
MARHLGVGAALGPAMFNDLFQIITGHDLGVPPEVAALFRALATVEGADCPGGSTGSPPPLKVDGSVSSAAQMAGSMSIATVFAISGTLLALTAPAPGRWVFGAIITGSATLALLALIAARRVIPGNQPIATSTV